jgi:hydroxymethylbilane synthase
MAQNCLVIASRESALAMWQSQSVRQHLLSLYPNLLIRIEGMTTRGDRLLHQSLAKIGGKGLFIKELEHVLLEQTADIAVHSLKDVPMDLPKGFVLAAITKRAIAFDAFVSNHYTNIASLPIGATVGTSSLRRAAQILALYPHLQIKGLRGNVQTRLNKLDNGDYDAIILAAAGLERLGLQHRIQAYLRPEDVLPAAGQGALAIEVAEYRDDLLNLLKPLHHFQTAACVTAERTLARLLGGSCQIPLAAYCVEKANCLELKALVASPDGATVLRASAQAPLDQAEHLGVVVAKQLAQQGAQELIATVLSD